MASPLSLSSASRRAFDRLAADLKRVLGNRFVALVAYGAGASAAFVSAIHHDDLEALGPLVDSWRRDDLAAPLLLTPEEFHRSLDAFPLEYQAMLDRHVVISGEPPFAGAAIRPEDLRRACEAQARAHLIHLRQGWLQSAAHPHDLDELVVRSSGPFQALLSNLARLHGAADQSNTALAAFAERTIGMKANIVKTVLALNENPDQGAHLRQRLGEYLDAAEQLWKYADSWRAS